MWQEGSKDERKQGDTHMGKRGRKTETQRKLETERTGDRERQSERKGISGRECTSKSVCTLYIINDDSCALKPYTQRRI